MYVRALLEAPSASIADVAYELRYSSPQSLSRHIRQNLGLTTGEFRREHSFAEIVTLYVSNLIVPFRETSYGLASPPNFHRMFLAKRA